MKDDPEHDSEVSKGYLYFLAGTWFLLILILLMAVSAKADVTNELSTSFKNDTDDVVDGTVSPAILPENGQKFVVTNTAPLIDDCTLNETALRAVEKSITLFRDRIKRRFSRYLERSARYLDITRKVFKDKSLPEDLAFLPIVESGFNVDAYSRAMAVGPWQFIASTGKRYGLVIDWWRDERKDPVKSTMAAANYLKDLYETFGSWDLALAAYNAGEGKISRALSKSDLNGYWSLLNTDLIKKETKEYVPNYIAAARIANNPEEYGFNNLEYGKPLQYDEVDVSSPLDIDAIAKCAKCTITEIRELNPELRRWSTPPNVGKYTIRIPKGSTEIFLDNLAAIPEGDQFTVEHYTLKKGDTIKKIARKTGIPTSTIIAMNFADMPAQLKAGDMINIPPKGKFHLDPDDRASLIQKVSYKRISYKTVLCRKQIDNRHSDRRDRRVLSGRLWHKSKNKRRHIIRA